MKRSNSPHRATRSVILGTLVALSVLGCAANGSSDTSVASSVSTSDDGAVNGSDQSSSPQRIVILSPAHTEIVFALGAGDQVVAVDAMSNYPPEAAKVLTTLSGFEPNVESIVGYEPDLVVIGDDFNGLAGQLQSVGIESWTSPAPRNFDEVLSQIQDLGERIGRSREAGELVASMRREIDAIVASTPTLSTPLTYYHEIDDTYYTVTSNTFIGSVYSLFGLRNIADAAEGNSDYPQLSAEFIVSQDPDFVFLADTKCCAVTAESVAARPGWDSLSAVRDGHVVALDDDVASRWGPRLVDFVRAIAGAVSKFAESAN